MAGQAGEAQLEAEKPVLAGRGGTGVEGKAITTAAATAGAATPPQRVQEKRVGE
jgi:hypothetical protein